MRFIVKFSVSLFALLDKSLKAFFSGVWDSGVDGFFVEVAKADAAIEVDMEEKVEVESAEVVEVEAGAALEGVEGKAEVDVEAGTALEGISVQAGVASEVDKVAAEAAG